MLSAASLPAVRPGASLTITVESGDVDVRVLASGPAHPSTGYDTEIITRSVSGNYMVVVYARGDDLFVRIYTPQ